MSNVSDACAERKAPIAVDRELFRRLGHQLVDDIAARLEQVPHGPVTPGERPSVVRAALDSLSGIPEHGADPQVILERATRVLFDHSLFNGHPRFLGYITSSPAPIGMLGDLLAAAVNANVGAWTLSPAATEIESQTVRWIAEFIGYPRDCGGLMVSGGNMANMVGYFAARAAGTPWDVRSQGMGCQSPGALRIYASAETHTWLQKAADLSGLGTASVRWIPTDADQRMRVDALVQQLDADRSAGDIPLMVVGTAGTVSTGAVDPLPEIAAVCRTRNVWFHVDGAYGGVAAALSGDADALRGLSAADSVAVDPHKWMYAPLEAGCCLVRDAERLRAAFTFHPPYYHFDEAAVNYVDYGPQNSRGFRALKVWLALQHVGASGYRQMIADDLALARVLADAVRCHQEFELRTINLSIVTFRYVPADLRSRIGDGVVESYLNDLNRELLDVSQRAGELFVSNAVIAGTYVLRACIVNFNTSERDVRAVPGLLLPIARQLDGDLRPEALR